MLCRVAYLGCNSLAIPDNKNVPALYEAAENAAQRQTKIDIMQKDIAPNYLAEQGLSETFPQRFWKRVFITPTHWIWDGLRRAPMNHGTLWRGVRNDKGTFTGQIYAHIASWILNVGPVPEGMWVLHKCPGRHVCFCVNPEHLYLGNAEDNSRDTQQQIEQGFIQPQGLHSWQRKQIRERYSGKHGEMRALASEYGVSSVRIGQIVSGTQAHIERGEILKAERERPRLAWPPVGENNGNARLTREIVEQIRREYTGENGQQTELAKKYGVQQAAIWKIVNHRIWR